MGKTPLSIKDKNGETIYIETKNLETINIFYSSMYKESKTMICLGMSYFDDDAKKKLTHKEVTYSFGDIQLCFNDFETLSKLMRLKWEGSNGTMA